MNILFTGSSSFIGHHLINHLSKKYNVYWVISKPKNKYDKLRKKRLKNLNSKKSLIINLQKKINLENLFNRKKFDYIFLHHAYTKNANNDKIFNFKKAININCANLDQIFKLSKKYNVKKIIHTGTNQEYGNYSKPIKESNIKRPVTLYGLSKLIQSDYCKFLAETYKVKCNSIKIYNVFGKDDNPKKITSHIVNNLKKNKFVDLSKCDQIRDFIHIGDVCRGFEKILKIKNNSYFEEYNLCSSKKITLKKILIKICKYLGVNVNLLNFGAIPLRKNEIKFNIGSNSKIKKSTDFKINFNKSIKDYIDSEKN